MEIQIYTKQEIVTLQVNGGESHRLKSPLKLLIFNKIHITVYYVVYKICKGKFYDNITKLRMGTRKYPFARFSCCV